MRKVIHVLLILFCSCFSAGAQDASKERTLSVNADIGLYLFSHWVSGTQINGLVQAQFPVAGKFAITTTTGIGIAPSKSYYKQSLKEQYGVSSGLYLPVWVGGRYYLVKGLHANLELGADVKLNQLASTQFHFSPGVGYVVSAGKSGFFNFSTQYITGFKRGTSSFDFRIGYMFPL